jgi:hypothetical protein
MPGGRPLKFETVEILQEKIDLYFATIPQEEWTITGLALALDTDRHTLINYEEREEYFHTIKKAKEMVHNAYELDLRKKGRSGDIFALKNFGWTDKQETDLTSGGEKIQQVPIYGGLSRHNSDQEDISTDETD